MKCAWFGCLVLALACGAREEPVQPIAAPPVVSPPEHAESPAIDAGEVDASVASIEVGDGGVDATAEAAAPRKVVNVKLPGRCVDTQLHAAKEMVKLHPGQPDLEVWKESVHPQNVDLDGDGTDDELRFGGATNMTTRSFVYVMRGKCGHFLGTIESTARMGVLESEHRGLWDLGGTAGCQVDCCSSLKYEEWRFDGVRYRLAVKKSVTQECKPRF